MKLLFLFGDGASGKMTVGQELTKITDLRLLHNHMTIEPAFELFGETRWKTTYALREIIFEDFATLDCYGMIFTYMMAFNLQSECDYVEHVVDIFKKHNAELSAPLEVRLQRNITENRLLHKPSKRDLDKSNQFLLNHKYRYVSNDGEIPFDNYIKIDNTHLSPEEAAKTIKERFLF